MTRYQDDRITGSAQACSGGYFLKELILYLCEHFIVSVCASTETQGTRNTIVAIPIFMEFPFP
jgi:hypothetical protein